MRIPILLFLGYLGLSGFLGLSPTFAGGGGEDPKKLQAPGFLSDLRASCMGLMHERGRTSYIHGLATLRVIAAGSTSEVMGAVTSARLFVSDSEAITSEVLSLFEDQQAFVAIDLQPDALRGDRPLTFMTAADIEQLGDQDWTPDVPSNGKSAENLDISSYRGRIPIFRIGSIALPNGGEPAWFVRRYLEAVEALQSRVPGAVVLCEAGTDGILHSALKNRGAFEIISNPAQ